MDFIRNNPALFYSLSIGLGAAIVTVLVEAGVNLSPGLSTAIEALIVMLAATIIGVATHGKVVALKNVLEYREVQGVSHVSSDVTAGPANDRRAVGEVVRPYGDPVPGREPVVDPSHRESELGPLEPGDERHEPLEPGDERH